MPNQTGVMQVRLQVKVSEVWQTDRQMVSQQICLETNPEGTVLDRCEVEAPAQRLVTRADLLTNKSVVRLLRQGDPVVGVVGERSDEIDQENKTEEQEQTPLNLIAPHFCKLKDPRMDRKKNTIYSTS